MYVTDHTLSRVVQLTLLKDAEIDRIRKAFPLDA